MTESSRSSLGGSAPRQPQGAAGETTVDSTGRLDAEQKRNLDELSREQLVHTAGDLGIATDPAWDKAQLLGAIEQGQRLALAQRNDERPPATGQP